MPHSYRPIARASLAGKLSRDCNDKSIKRTLPAKRGTSIPSCDQIDSNHVMSRRTSTSTIKNRPGSERTCEHSPASRPKAQASSKALLGIIVSCLKRARIWSCTLVNSGSRHLVDLLASDRSRLLLRVTRFLSAPEPRG